MSYGEKRWRGVGVTLTGSSKSSREECQDYVALYPIPGSAAVFLTVADGAGSRSRSGVGAATLVNHAGRHLNMLDTVTLSSNDPDRVLTALEELIDATVTGALRSLESEAPDGLEDFAATFGVALVTSSLVAMGAVGDVFACVRRAGEHDRVHLVLPPRRDHRVTAGTHFVTAPDWRAHLDLVVVVDDAVDAVVLSTDGLEEAALGYAHVANADSEHNGRTVARDVYLIPQMLTLVDEGAGEDTLSAELCVAKIMDRKGDDIGVALAVGYDTLPR